MYEVLEAKQKALQTEIGALRHAMENETKSSAGDKFETGREMMQAELNKAENQLRLNEMLTMQLQLIDAKSASTMVKFGSLVATNSGYYFISLPLGTFWEEGKEWITLSLASPLGKMLMGKKVEEKFAFQGKEFEVVGLW